MIRCKPLLGSFVEITAADGVSTPHAIEMAFSTIHKVQVLMGFHKPESELSQINASSYLKPVRIHPWTAEVLSIAQEMYQQSKGVFNCGIGHRLVQAGLLPKYFTIDVDAFGGIEDLKFLDSDLVSSRVPLCLDLGGIAKGYAVDKAVEVLQANSIRSGLVNAGGDMRVFGDEAQPIQIRNPSKPVELIEIGSIKEGAIATSSLYFSKRDANFKSYVVNPLNQELLEFSESYSVIAAKCVYADALTKVVSITGNAHHPCLEHFSAQALVIPNGVSL